MAAIPVRGREIFLTAVVVDCRKHTIRDLGSPEKRLVGAGLLMTWLDYLDTQTSRRDDIGEVAREVIAKFQGPEAERLRLTAETADFERQVHAIGYFINLHFGVEMTLRVWQEYSAAMRRLV